MKCGDNLQMQQTGLSQKKSIYQIFVALPVLRIELKQFRNQNPHRRIINR